MPKKPRVLFVLKLRQTSGGYGALKSSGLLNSATFVSDMLLKNGYTSKLVQVVDNNGIDKEVTEFKPDVVIIEALWVVPEKFDVLCKLHPKVKWIIRAHSEIPFLANEGSSLGWINQYITKENVYVSFNSDQTHSDFTEYVKSIDKKLIKKLIYLPNYYPVLDKPSKSRPKNVLNVGCFGAMRPMKNALIQAFAAVEYANDNNLRCIFHVNAGRIEQHGESVLKNLRQFFEGLKGKHELVEHPWLEREEFLQLVSKMQLGLQVSFSETFNIVSADFVSQGVPIVTSDEIDWMPSFFTANETNVQDIATSIGKALWYDKYFSFLDLPRRSLRSYVKLSEKTWLDNLPKLV